MRGNRGEFVHPQPVVTRLPSVVDAVASYTLWTCWTYQSTSNLISFPSQPVSNFKWRIYTIRHHVGSIKNVSNNVRYQIVWNWGLSNCSSGLQSQPLEKVNSTFSYLKYMIASERVFLERKITERNRQLVATYRISSRTPSCCYWLCILARHLILTDDRLKSISWCLD